jgi:hypothetical protein
VRVGVAQAHRVRRIELLRQARFVARDHRVMGSRISTASGGSTRPEGGGGTCEASRMSASISMASHLRAAQVELFNLKHHLRQSGYHCTGRRPVGRHAARWLCSCQRLSPLVSWR